ncbi:MAG: 3-deoxy-D-manno-octulosonic acid kinase [Kangiellaceae bacterium]|nr:3-deoxy-D-manno-octulosonic acid kinase [Kangiellaceae bacterium]
MTLTIKKDGSSILILPDSSELSNQIQTNWFEPEYWRQQNKISGESKGRHTTWFVKPIMVNQSHDQQWALRHYYRGGLIAKIITDNFLFARIKSTRAYREVSLLKTMKNSGLPVPRVIGARVMKRGLFYTADLLMEKLAGIDLVTLIKEKPLSNDVWCKIGEIIAEFHKKGIYHADLNSHNIMILEKAGNANVWLIDFDKCKQRKRKKSAKNSWQSENLDRLYRSLVKEKDIFSTVNFDQNVVRLHVAVNHPFFVKVCEAVRCLTNDIRGSIPFQWSAAEVNSFK